jgi:hypothetical protein
MKVTPNKYNGHFLYNQNERGTIHLTDLDHTKYPKLSWPSSADELDVSRFSFSIPEEVGHYLARRLGKFFKSGHGSMYVFLSSSEEVFDSEGFFACPCIQLGHEGVHIEKCSTDDTLNRIEKGFLEQIVKEK